jgi:hypothetical protein
MNIEVNEAVDAALALAGLLADGKASRIDGAMRDRIVMAQEISRLREALHQIQGAVNADALSVVTADVRPHATGE